MSVLLAAVAILGTSGAALAQDLPLRNWPAPAYWSPGTSSTGSDGTPSFGHREALVATPPPLSAPLPFVALTPCRVADTRSAYGFSGPFGPPSLTDSMSRDFPITASPCGIPPAAAAVSFNFTVTNTLAPRGHLTVWPQGGTQPNVSTLNFLAGQTVANAAIVPLGTSGGITTVTVGAGLDLIIDVNGYYDGTGMATQGVTSNPLQIALLKWYPANQSGATFSVGLIPIALAFDGANIWVAGGDSSGTVMKLRASDGASLGTFSVGSYPRGVAFDGANIWVGNNVSNNVTKLRASDGANLGTFSVGSAPGGLAFDGASIWVANAGSNNVTKLRASDGANLGTFGVGSGPDAIAFDGANIWVANSGSSNVTKLRASDGACVGTCTFVVGITPYGVAFDGANIWVASNGGGNVKKLRASDGTVLGTFGVGANPVAVAFDGANIWVANLISAAVTKLRASDGANLGTFSVGSGPVGFAFDGVNIWVASTSGTVTKL